MAELKGGPKKIADVKSKVSMPKTKATMPKEDKSSGGKGFKAPKSGGGKIKAPSATNFVKPHLGAKKADVKFSIPKPGMPKKSAPKKAVGKRR